MATIDDAREYISERRTVASEAGRSIEMFVRWEGDVPRLVFCVSVLGSRVKVTESIKAAWSRYVAELGKKA